MIKLIATLMFVAVAQAQQQDLALRLVHGNISGPMLAAAKAQATAILRQAGVRVRWTERPASPTTECSGPLVDVSRIDILIQDHTHSEDHPGALGYSRPFARDGFRVVIFYDRVITWTLEPSPRLLGHVIAHEVGHMLLGTLSHAPGGVMLAHWTREEMHEMQFHPLPFTPSDAELITERMVQQDRSCKGKSLLALR